MSLTQILEGCGQKDLERSFKSRKPSTQPLKGISRGCSQKCLRQGLYLMWLLPLEYMGKNLVVSLS